MNDQRTIMVVEDDVDISDAIAATLEDRGYAVIVAMNGEDALHKLRETDKLPRMILLDLMMPVMDGWQFRAAQLDDPMLAEVPVVLLSAHINVRKAADELRALAWLKKPIDLRTLLNVVGSGSVGRELCGSRP